MKAGEVAQEYLRTHKEYIDALKALLADLDQAWRSHDSARCDLLCDAMIHMQRLEQES